MMAMGLFLCGGARAGDAAATLREALELARNGEFRVASSMLPDPAGYSPSDTPRLEALAAALRDPAPDAALRLLAAARRLDPDAARPKVMLEEMWAERPLPPLLHARDVPFFPVDAQTLALPAARGVAAAEIVTVQPGAFLSLPTAKEPRSGAVYPRVLGVYARGGDTLALRFAVRYVSDGMAGRAIQVGRWLGALSRLSDAMLGPASQARYPVAVWLSPNGAPGAETWNGSIVIHDAGAERSALEWVRQLTHEWGHAAIPGGGGFRNPEAWAAGDLGERLFPPAMRDAGWLSAWGEPLDIKPYERAYVDPPRAAFARTGPVPDLVKGDDEAAYNHYLGACLYVAAAYGPPVLAAALDDLDGPRTSDFLAAVSRALSARKEWTVARVPDVVGPAAVCFPARGRYMLEAHGPDGRREILAGPKDFPAGWTCLDWQGVLTVRRPGATGKE